VAVSGAGRQIAKLRIGRDAVLREGNLAIVSADARASLLAALQRAPKLHISFAPAPGERGTFAISLAGATAALLWMDERQQRVGTTSAVIRPGTRPAAFVPVPPDPPRRPMPVVPTGGPAPDRLSPDVVAQLDELRTEGCDEDIREIEPTRSPAIVRLAPAKLLVSLVCWPGASSIGATYFIVDEGPAPKVERAHFPRRYLKLLSETTETTPDFVLFNADTTLKDGTIDHSEGSAQDGHCGEQGTWAWTGERFEPVEVSALMPCGGASVAIRLYRTQ